MKKVLLTLGIFAFLTSAQISLAQITPPQPSAKAKTETTVGLTEVSISYFRPSVKGRAIFGEGKEFLQPFGTLWRAGANSGSILTLSTDAKIAGQDVKAGEYMILLVPGADTWEFILNSDLSIGGAVNNFKRENEVVSAQIKPINLDNPIETLTFNISDISEDMSEANIYFAWGNYALEIPIKVNYDAIVMEQIVKNTKVNPSNYIMAANYYYTADKDLNQALIWVNDYLSEGNNSQQFWNLHLKAKILAKLGQKKEAIEVAKKSMELAKNNKGGDFGYVKNNEDLIASLK
jgi:tetratricopeptide (TPR) repeat protein